MAEIIWEVCPCDYDLQEALAQGLKVSPLTAQVLINRGIRSVEEGRLFLQGGLKALSSPYELPGVNEAVARVEKAVHRKEKVLIYGDYDVDGLTASALLGEILKKLGLEVEYYLPHRLEEGYGVKIGGLETARSLGCHLVITVDCGITATEEAAWAKKNDLDLIITDHHRPGPVLPQALSLINPWLAGGGGALLAGVGVAFKLAQALAEFFSLPPQAGVAAGWALDLVALGTLADAMPLLGENRALVQLGLEELKKAERPGIRALLEVAGLKWDSLDDERVALGLVPRLNAAGRLGSAWPALELLLTSSSQRAWELAQALNLQNQTRQLLEDQVWSEALTQAEEAVTRGDPGLVLTGWGWHPGVLGIVAARLVERFRRPTILISLEPSGKGRGSGRAQEGIDLFQILKNCASYLLAYGGHGQAIGLEIEAEKIPAFQEAFFYALEAASTRETFKPRLKLDAEARLSQLDLSLVEELKALAPFGTANPRPLFLYRGARLISIRQVGPEGAHLKLKLQAEGREVSAIGFRMALPPDISIGSKVDLAFRPEGNTFNGETELELVVEAMRPVAPSPITIKVDSPTSLEVDIWPTGDKDGTVSREARKGWMSTWSGAILEELKGYWEEGSQPVTIILSSGLGVLSCYYGLKSILPPEAGPLVARGPWLPEGKLVIPPSLGILLEPFELWRKDRGQKGREVWSPGAREAGRELSLGHFNYGFTPDPVKLAWEMASQAKRVLIYTEHPSQARRLAQLLWQRGKFKVGLDEGLIFEEKLLLRRQALAGDLKLLVGVGWCPAWFYPAEVVLFTYLPRGKEELELALPLQEERPEVYIAAHALSKGPPLPLDPRGFLAHLYKRLQAISLRKKALYLHNNVASNYLFRCGLNILEELRLINIAPHGEGIKVWVKGVPKSKQDLNRSWRYRQLCRDYEEVFAFWRELTRRRG
ncbi:single-stranded-DNA-specific exonuclease [Thermanaeromonas toyohensis ToBE]|uniref:Single-stranded-DNA-specific exonuclease RecJ n=1 Tax=Thermanaeromonas toyohensis ToBE TaxID=698762 RepID=A0A1W1VZR4_9FIRM|nr:single-stranded-DNA-specific exonuclease RecJ [Thermanaeromonas toyohensis]SMB98847.1 single-stranded-DNA-specific exonuclease [Thermanaeromonas toyohensis ToBE]